MITRHFASEMSSIALGRDVEKRAQTYGNEESEEDQQNWSPGFSPNGGSTDIPGMSIHCNSCKAKISKADVARGRCPKCGAPTKPHRNLKAPEDLKENSEQVNPTGLEAAEQEGVQEAKENEYIKGAAVKPNLVMRALQSMSPKARAASEMGIAAIGIGGTGYGVYKAKKFFGGRNPEAGTEQWAPKTAAARNGNPIIRIRKARKLREFLRLAAKG